MAYKYTNADGTFIAPYGHDVYGDGTREYPYATTDRAIIDDPNNIIALSGFYYHQNLNNGCRIKAESTATFISTTQQQFGHPGITIHSDIVLIGYQSYGNISTINTRISFKGSRFSSRDIFNSLIIVNSTCHNIFDGNQNTIHSYGVLTYESSTVRRIHHSNSVIIGDELQITTIFNSLTYTCIVVPIIEVNSTPIDFTGANTSEQRVDRIRTALANEFGGVASDYLEGCLHFNSIADCKFNDPDNNDYTLQADSPLAYASDTSSYIGAYDVAIKLFADVDGADAANLPTAVFEGSFLASSAVNLDFNQSTANRSEHYFTPTDPSLISSIESKPLFVDRIRQLGKVLKQGADASRNGLTTTGNLSLSDTVITPTFNGSEYEYTGIEEHKIYRIEGGSFTYNGNVYEGGAYIIGINGITTATTLESGARLRPSVFFTDERPNRQSVLMRSSRGGSILTNADTLTFNFWYYVTEDTVTYDGTTYNPGDFILTNGVTNTFTGSGLLIEVFADSETYRPYNWENDVNINTDDDTINGAITESNADDNYDFSIEITHTSKFVQFKLVFDPHSIPASIV